MTEMLWWLSFYRDYAQIALDNYTNIKLLLEKRKVIDDKYDKSGQISEEEDDEWGEINRDINKHARIVIVFCALSLEAFINDYAIHRFSKCYFDNYLDKLKLYSKWVIIPRLFTGLQLDTSSQPMQDLAWLVKQRNTLVHYKAEMVEVSKLGARLSAYNEQAAQRAISAVKNIVLALHEIDKEANETWLKYEGEWFPSKRLQNAK